MKINQERLWQMHEKLANFTDPNLPYTRRSFTPLYEKARAWLKNEFLKLDLETKFDEAGNLLGFYKGQSDDFIAIGSHTDTVPGGGRFDGISGVLSFLEIATVFRENNYSPKLGILGIDFLAEEPSFFGLSCIGSRLATGSFNPEMLLLKNEITNKSLKESIDEIGANAALLKPNLSLFDTNLLKAYLELHIEQGRVLEENNLDVGLVRAICSVTRYDFEIFGEADHAGNTPMNMRKDALLFASYFVSKTSEIAHKITSSSSYFTATVGKLEVFPNGSNVIAQKVKLSLDIRSEDNSLVDVFMDELLSKMKEIELKTNTNFKTYKISQGKPSISDEGLVNLLENNAKKLNLKYMKILSGAGHDAAYMSNITKMAMIFIPCKGGKSHVSTEFSSKEQIAKGAELLLQTAICLSKG